MMVLVLIVGGGAGWWVRQSRIWHGALTTIRAAGGHIVFKDEQGDAWQWLALLYRWTGNDFFRQVATVFLVPPPPLSGSLGDLVAPRPSYQDAFEAVSQLGRVEIVDVYGGPVTAEGLATLVSADVGHLGLHRIAEVSDAMLNQLRRMRDLKVLVIDMPGGKLPKVTLQAVADLKQLEGVGLYGFNNLQSDDFAPLRGKNLNSLNLSKSPIDEACLDHLDPLEQFTDLHLEKTRVTDAGLSRLVAKAPRLESVTLDGSLLTDSGVAALASLPRLSTLRLLGNPTAPGQLTDASLVTLGRVRSIEQLVIKCGRFTDVGLDALRDLPLDRLILDSIEASEAGCARLLAGRTFSRLGLHGPGVTDAILPHLVGHLLPKAVLDLSRSKITDAGMSHLAPLKIQGLILNKTSLTDSGLATLGTGTTVRELIAWETQVTPAGAATFRTVRPGVNLFIGPVVEDD